MDVVDNSWQPKRIWAASAFAPADKHALATEAWMPVFWLHYRSPPSVEKSNELRRAFVTVTA